MEIYPEKRKISDMDEYNIGNSRVNLRRQKPNNLEPYLFVLEWIRLLISCIL